MITNSSSSAAYFNIDESGEDSNDDDEELSLLTRVYDDSHRCKTPLVSNQNLSETLLINTTTNIHRDQKTSTQKNTSLKNISKSLATIKDNEINCDDDETDSIYILDSDSNSNVDILKSNNNDNYKKKLLALNRVSASRSREKKKMLHIQMDIKREVIESRNFQLRKRLERMQSIKDYLNTFISCQKRVFLLEPQQNFTTPSTSILTSTPPTVSASSSSSSSSSSSPPYNIPSSFFFSSQSDESNEKQPVQVQTKTNKKMLRRSRRRETTDEEDRQLSQSLKRLYQEIEEQQIMATSLNVDEEKRLLNEFFSLLPSDEQSSLLTCSAALMSEGNRDLNQIELETNNFTFASINNDIQHLLNVDFVDTNLD